jgi:Spy/CpxP family protein refolding chaperone
MNEESTNVARPGRSRRWYIAAAAAVAIAATGAFGVQAFADSKTYAHMKQFASGERGGWHGGGHGGRFASMTDEEIAAQVERMVKHVAIEIDATPEQTGKITALLTAVATDLKPLRESMRDTRRQVHEILTAGTIDRAALETLRAERLAEADRISKNLVTALADVAEVLTPEQRKVLDERIEEFRSMRGRWHRG